MNKNELVAAVADSAKLSKGDAQAAVDAVFNVITAELKNGGDVRLVGFKARCINWPQSANRRRSENRRTHRSEVFCRKGLEGCSELGRRQCRWTPKPGNARLFLFLACQKSCVLSGGARSHNAMQ
jgi:hypothetical protein